ncbi:splicing factor [Dinochytrium kinnereticum]|nr:splicing factor [Dinochytrium kinnereticum]
MAAEQRKLLEQLMGKESLGGVPDKIHFKDPEVCRDYLCGLCPHDLFTNTKVDLGPCPKKHMEKLKKEYEEAVARRDHYGFEDEWMRSLAAFCTDCDRKVDHARRRLEKTPEDAKLAQFMKELDDLTKEISVLTALVEKLGEEGNVDESLESLRQVEKLQETKLEKEKELKTLVGSDQSQHQKLRVCGICSAYLSIFDSDRRLADHFQGKMHLGFKAVRDKLEELQKKAAESGRRIGPDRERDNRDDRFRDRDFRGDRDRDRDYDRGGRSRRDDYDRYDACLFWITRSNYDLILGGETTTEGIDGRGLPLGAFATKRVKKLKKTIKMDVKSAEVLDFSQDLTSLPILTSAPAKPTARPIDHIIAFLPASSLLPIRTSHAPNIAHAVHAWLCIEKLSGVFINMFSFRLGWASSGPRSGSETASSARPFTWTFAVEKPKANIRTTKAVVMRPIAETFPSLSDAIPTTSPVSIGRHTTYKAALLSEPPATLRMTKEKFQKSSRFLVNRLRSSSFMPMPIIRRSLSDTKKPYQKPSFSAKKDMHATKSSAPLPQPRLSRPIIDICRDRRRRITGVKRSMPTEKSRKEIAKALNTPQSITSEAQGILSPLWARFDLIWNCAIAAPLALF